MTSFARSAAPASALAASAALALGALLAAAPAAADVTEAARAEAPALLSRALARVENGPGAPLYAYEVDFTVNGVSGRLLIDPGKPEGERVSVLEALTGGSADDRKQALKDMTLQTDGDIWCASALGTVPARAELSSATPRAATYVFTPVKSDDPVDEDLNRAVEHLVGSLVLARSDGQPFSYQLHAPRAFKPMMIAKIDSLSAFTSCERAPDGRTYAALTQVSVEGRAAFRGFSDQRRIAISGLRPASAS